MKKERGAKSDLRKKEYNDVYFGPELFVELRKYNCYQSVVWLMLISWEFYKNNKLSFYEGLLFEDQPFALECLLKSKRISHRRYIVCKHRHRENSISTDKCSFTSFYGYVYGYFKLIPHAFAILTENDLGLK